jgi:ABC-type glycerol-3-phosphate transport system substrate-binding protein
MKVLKSRRSVSFIIITFLIAGIYIAGTSHLAFAQEKRIRVLGREQQGKSMEVMNKIVKGFEEKNPGVKVEVEFAAFDELMTKMVTAIQANRAYEAVQGPSWSMAANLGARQLIVPLNDVVDALGRDDYIKGLLPDFWGNNFQIPYWSYACGLWYRADLFKNNGLKPPETWDDMLNAAKTLTKGDQYGYSLIYGPTGWTNEHLVMYYYANGGKVCDKDFNIVFDKEPYRTYMRETLEFFKKLKPYSPPGAVDYSWNEGQIAFAQGKVAMSPYWMRLLDNVVTHNPAIEPYTRLTHIPLGPHGKMRGAGGGAHGWVVMAQSRYPELGKAFVKYFMSGENYVDFLLAIPAMYQPSTKSYSQNARWLSHPLIQSHKQDLMIASEAAKMPLEITAEWTTEDPKLWNMFGEQVMYGKALTNFVHKVLVRGDDIGKAIDEAAQATREELTDSKKTVLQEIGEQNLVRIMGKARFDETYKGIK